MSTTIEKAKLAYEDVHFDTQGTSATTQTKKSDGTYRTVQKINASHVPITTTCRAKKQASGAAIGTTDVDATLIQALDDLEDLGQPNTTELEVAAGLLRLVALGIAGTKLAADCITGTKIADDQIDSEHYVAQSIDAEHLNQTGASEAVVTAAIRDANVTHAKLADNAVENHNILAGTIAASKLACVPTHYVVLAGNVAVASGLGPTAVTVTGVAATDILSVSMRTSTAVAAVKAVPSLNTITFTFHADPGASTTIDYVVFRAAT